MFDFMCKCVIGKGSNRNFICRDFGGELNGTVLHVNPDARQVLFNKVTSFKKKKKKKPFWSNFIGSLRANALPGAKNDFG